MHKTCLPQLTHARIDNGVAGLALLPCFELSFAIVPRKGRELVFERDVGHFVEEIDELITEFAPADLCQKLING